MQTRHPFLTDGRPPGPVARFFATLLALAILAVSIVFGLVFFLSALAAAAIIGIFFWIQSRRSASGRPRPRAGSGTTLEGDFEVIEPKSREQGPAGR
jgi:predicted membrane metal-binding protein